ncbi:MAG: (2Fe-2S) ferredoxin domain-containing protein [Trueperaceae bacterium]
MTEKAPPEPPAPVQAPVPVQALTTKRRKLAHVLVCDGCCCGRTEKGRPEVPLEYLKTQWKSRKLLKSVQLTIAGCLGPCDLANVVSVQSFDEKIYLGKLTVLAEYELLLEWATQCTTEDRLLPLPASLLAHQFEQFRASSCPTSSLGNPGSETTNNVLVPNEMRLHLSEGPRS